MWCGRGFLTALLILLSFSFFPDAARAVECPRDGILTAGATDYYPFQIVRENSISGFDFEVIEAVLKKMGCQLEVVDIPWSRHLIYMKSGKVDIAASVTMTPDRLTFSHFSVPYLMSKQVLFVRSEDKDKYLSLREFFENGQILGIVRDYEYGEAFSKLRAQFPAYLVESDTDELNLNKLAARRVSGILGDHLITSSHLNVAGLSDRIVATNFSVAQYPAHFMFSRQSISSEFVDRFNEVLMKMNKKGEFKFISAKYGFGLNIPN